jgi:hypothetical protein
VAPVDAKEGQASRRSSGIANIWPFAQRQSMDAGEEPSGSCHYSHCHAQMPPRGLVQSLVHLGPAML